MNVTPFVAFFSIQKLYSQTYMQHIHSGLHNHYVVMLFIMILSGVFSTMNVWVDRAEHIRFSVNDLYMILLMTGWMFFFMGVFYRETFGIAVGGGLVVVILWCIRTQFLVTESQYRIGMIPHHSMAIHMSRRLLERPNDMQPFLDELISTQSREIEILRQ